MPARWIRSRRPGRGSAPRGSARGADTRRAVARPDAAGAASFDGVEAVYARALRRTQLRLALGTIAGFVVVMVAVIVAIALIPELSRIDVGGVPLSWLLHAFAFYP